MEMINFLEADREKLRQSLVEAGTPEQAEIVLGSEIDRLLLLFNENCGDDSERDAALQMMQTAKSMLPLICAQGEPRIWEKSGLLSRDSSGKSGLKGGMSALSLLALILGAALCIASLAAIMVTSGGVIGPVVFLKALPIMLVGCVLLFWSGRQSMNPAGGFGKNKALSGAADGAERQIEMRIDPDKIWSCMRAMILVVDRNVKDVRDRNAARKRAQREASGGNISGREITLLSDLLELSYSQRLQPNSMKNQAEMQAQAAEEMIDDIKFYLHEKEVKVLDYGKDEQKNHKDWFERLPASSGKTVTLRPALVQDGRLLRKGMAAAEN